MGPIFILCIAIMANRKINPYCAETEYGVTFCSALAKGNLVATQFHPEKSGELGLQMYENFIIE